MDLKCFKRGKEQLLWDEPGGIKEMGPHSGQFIVSWDLYFIKGPKNTSGW